MTKDAEQLAVSTVRTLAIDAVERADSGHPGAPMGLAPLGWVLFTRHHTHNPADPQWPNRDRFVLSAGHASMLQYALLHLTGYDVSIDDLKGFRQLGSSTPGHPEHFETPGVDTTTGPLGQGFTNAVGFALAERLLAARYNRPGHDIVDHRTWVIASDGDMMEGVASEAASLAGHLGLDRLVVFFDDNRITLDGPAEDSYDHREVAPRFAAYGWRVLEVSDANDLDELDRVMSQAAEPDGRPTLVRVPTTIGYGAPTKADSSEAHGSPLGEEEARGAKEFYGWDYPPFTVPDEVRELADQRKRGGERQSQWQERFAAYREEYADLAAEFERVMAGKLPDDWDADVPEFEVGSSEATRASSGKVINALATRLPELFSGSADLSGSTKTEIDDAGMVVRGDFSGRNMNWGVREHAMASAMNGMVLHGGVRPLGGTFLTFSDYARPAIRLAALMGVGAIYVMTHDSIGLGEDGPTHQPVEHLAALRAIPNLHVIRPADGPETVGAWRQAILRTEGPTLLSLSRQGLPVLERTSADEVTRGAYVVVDSDDPDIVLVATGSELQLAVEAVELLAEDDIVARVVSMPCAELFEEAGEEYQDEVLPPDLPVLSVEAGVSFGWGRWADDHVSLERFGASAPGPAVMEELGFTAQRVADAASTLYESYSEEDDS